ncbi:Alpha/Beta hydrolase protein [Helicostylum pulchrum]|nr:Alpha/Beta hydrolase protein [Helicostylum pulchrum]
MSNNLPKLNPTFVALMSVLPVIDYNSVPIEVLRTNHASTTLSDDIPRPKVTVQRIKIPTCEDGYLIPADMHRPASAISNEVLPAMIFLPGGGFCLPSQGGHPFIASKIHDNGEANCVVILAHYSLSPEVRYPVAVEECYSVFKWATNPDNASKLFFDPTKVAMGGDSSGASLTIGTSVLVKRRNLKNKMKHQILYYPAIYPNATTESHQNFTEGCILSKDTIDFFINNYISSEKDKLDPICFPSNLDIKDLIGLPPTLMITGEADPLRDEAEIFARRLLEAEVDVSSYRVQGVLHGFLSILLFTLKKFWKLLT